MNIILSALILILIVKLLLIASIRPVRSRYSFYELERRTKEGDVGARELLDRERSINYVMSIQRTAINLLVIAVGLIVVSFLGWVVGIISSVIFVMFLEPLAKLSVIKNTSKRLYEKYEKNILKFINKHQKTINFFSGLELYEVVDKHRVESVQELKHLIDTSDHVFSSEEKKLLSASAEFYDLRIKDVMTPRNEIIGINSDEFLGPLNLNDLHKTGHNFLPVFGTGMDNVVGVLELKKLLNLDIKKSMIAEKIMDKKVYYINENQDLYQGLVAFSRTHQHILMVVNKNIETVGLITQKDIIEAVIGRRISGDFDEYDDIKAIAKNSK